MLSLAPPQPPFPMPLQSSHVLSWSWLTSCIILPLLPGCTRAPPPTHSQALQAGVRRLVKCIQSSRMHEPFLPHTDLQQLHLLSISPQSHANKGSSSCLLPYPWAGCCHEVHSYHSLCMIWGKGSTLLLGREERERRASKRQWRELWEIKGRATLLL